LSACLKRFIIVLLILSMILLIIGCNKPDQDELTNNEFDQSDDESQTLGLINGNGVERDGLILDGEKKMVNFGFSPNFDVTDSFTFEVWVNFMGPIDSSTVLFGAADSFRGAYGLHTYFESQVSFGLRTNELGEMARVDYDLFYVNRWYHLAGVYDGNAKQVSLYINGELVGTDTLPGTDTGLTGRELVINGLQAIHGSPGQRGYSNCIVSEARLWSYARSQEEIVSDMNLPLNGDEEGLIGYWPLAEGEGAIAFDLSANENHGSINGGTWHSINGN